jgi:hypothetical protein
VEVVVFGCQDRAVSLHGSKYSAVSLPSVLGRLRVEFFYEGWVIDVNRIRTGSHNWTIFAVHFFNDPDVLTTADEVMIAIVP